MTYPILKIPDLLTTSQRVIEIPFNAIVPAGGNITLVSSLIPYAFRVLRIKMVFDNNSQNLLRVRWFISTSGGTSLTGQPSGDDIVATESPTPSFVGSNLVTTANINVDYPSDRHYIKMYAENGNLIDVIANGTVIIQALTTPPPTVTTPIATPALTPPVPVQVPPKGGAIPV